MYEDPTRPMSAGDLGRDSLMTSDRDNLWGGSPYDYQQRGNATATNISPQNLYSNSSMGGYMDSIMGGIMGSSPFLNGSMGAPARMPQAPQQQAPQQQQQAPQQQQSLMMPMQFNSSTDEPGSSGYAPMSNSDYFRQYGESPNSSNTPNLSDEDRKYAEAYVRQLNNN